MKIFYNITWVRPTLLSVLFGLLAGVESSAEPSASGLLGKWVLFPRESSNVDLFRTVSLEFEQVSPQRVVLTERWGGSRHHQEKLDLALGGVVNEFPINHKVFASNVFMGLRRPLSESRKISAQWQELYQVLRLEEHYTLLSSQGKSDFTSYSTLALDETGTILEWTIQRPTRPADQPLIFHLKREGYRDAYYMELVDDWEIDGLLPEQVALITLQGVVNEQGPLLYFIYPETWDFRFTDEIFEFYEEKKTIHLQENKFFASGAAITRRQSREICGLGQRSPNFTHCRLYGGWPGRRDCGLRGIDSSG